MRSARTLTALLLIGAVRDVAAQAPWAPMPGGESFSVWSESLGESREIFVLRPRAFGTDTTRHQVLVLLDGDGLLPPAAGVSTFYQLSAGHPPWLMVAVRSTSPNDRIRNFTPAPDSATRARYSVAGGADRFRRFLDVELRAFVAERFRTGPRWGLVGHSLAGLFVVDAFAHEDVNFTDYVAISPTLGWQNGEIESRAIQKADHGRSSPLRLFLSTADEGARYPSEPTRRVAAALGRGQARNVSWTHLHFSGEDHVTTVPPALHAALRWLESATRRQ